MAAATSLPRPDELQPLTRSTPLLSLPSLSGDDSARNVTPVEVALWLAVAAVTFRSLEATSAAAMMVGVSAADRTSFLAVRLAMDDSLLQKAVKALLHGCGYTGLTALRLRPWLQAASEASRDSKVWNEVMQHPAATPAVFRFLRVTGGADDEGDLTPRRRRQRDVALSLASDAVACVISASVDTAELKTDLAFAAFTHADSGGGSCYAHNRHIHYIPSAADIVTARASPVTATVPVEPSYVFLETLSVRFCGLRDVGQLCGATPKLRRLVLSNNVLTSLPLELIAGHPSLTYLDVSVNRLDGFHRMKKTPALAPHIAKESRLTHFDLSCNAFSGEFPPLPTTFANDLALLTFPLLEALDLNGNAGVRGISSRFLDRLPRGVLKFIGLAGCTTNDRASLKRTASLHFNLKPSAIQNIDAVTDGERMVRASGWLRCFSPEPPHSAARAYDVGIGRQQQRDASGDKPQTSNVRSVCRRVACPMCPAPRGKPASRVYRERAAITYEEPDGSPQWTTVVRRIPIVRQKPLAAAAVQRQVIGVLAHGVARGAFSSADVMLPYHPVVDGLA
jgi:hypothetical protein